MSTFDEQYNSIFRCKDFLYALMDPQQTPRVPKYVRERARQVIKHYPISLDIFIEDGYNKVIQNKD